jgi:membrane protease subunit HflK
MYQRGGRGGGQPELDFDQIMARARTGMGRLARRLGGGGVGLLVIGIIAVIVVIWAATGFYTVSPGENAVLRLFGNAQDIPVEQEGLHWWWPGPVGQRNVIQVKETRRMQLGFRGAGGGPIAPVGNEALMISGDLNIIDVRMVVQYNIKNLVDFLFRVDDPGDQARGIARSEPDGGTLKDASEAALRLVVGQRSIGEVLAEQRIDIQATTRLKLQEILDSYNTGINVISVELQNVQAPDQVRDAFDDVLRARQDKQTSINQAKAFENQILPEARGAAAQKLQAAEAFKKARIERATGEAEQFSKILKEYRKSPEVTKQRLYLEAMEEILPGISKIIVSPETESVVILGGKEGLTPLPIGPRP